MKIFLTTHNSPFGDIKIVWSDIGNAPRICRIFLPNQPLRTKELTETISFKYNKRYNAVIEGLDESFKRYFDGERIQFRLDLIRLDACSAFQRKVLLIEYKVPRGWVTTYSRLAIKVGNPNGARAVGRALSQNPFPIIIPCHRAIKSDMTLGGYQGGLEMKRQLLENEGIAFNTKGEIVTNKIYY